MSDWNNYWKSKSMKRKAIEFFRERYFTKVFCNTIEKHCPENGSILEAGCGSGTYLKRLSRKGYRCYGIDNSKKAVEIAKTNCENVFLGDISEISKQFKNKFDVIFSQGVMEHFNEKETEKIYEDNRKACKKMIVFVPSNLSLFKIFNIFKEENEDNTFFSRKELRRLMEKSFKNVKVKYLPQTGFLTIMASGEPK